VAFISSRLRAWRRITSGAQVLLSDLREAPLMDVFVVDDEPAVRTAL
jgi:hypothetical protein